MRAWRWAVAGVRVHQTTGGRAADSGDSGDSDTPLKHLKWGMYRKLLQRVEFTFYSTAKQYKKYLF